MTMLPEAGGLAALAWAFKKVLGGSLDEVGNAVERWTAYRLRNVGRVVENAAGKVTEDTAKQGMGNLDRDAKVGPYLDWWVEEVLKGRVQTEELSPRTAAGYESHVRNHIKPALGSAKLTELTPLRVEAFMREVAAKPNVSNATANRVRATLSKALSDAEKDGRVVRNVAQVADALPTERPEPNAFTQAEVRRIV